MTTQQRAALINPIPSWKSFFRHHRWKIAGILVAATCAHFTAAQQISVADGTIPAGIGPGSPAGSYSLSGFEHYNPFSGSLNPSIPLYHVGGRGEAGFDLIWKFQQTWLAAKRFGGAQPFIPINPYPDANLVGPQGIAGPLGAGAVFARTGSNFISCPTGGSAVGSTLARIVFETPDGTQIELVDQNTNGAVYTIPNACTQTPASVDAGRGNAFKSIDNSMLQFVSDSPVLDATAPGFGEADAKVSGYLRFANGMTYRIDNSDVSWIRDRNGNLITLQYNSGQHVAVTWYLSVDAPSQIIDSVGRTIAINYNDSSCGGCTTVTYPGFGGAARVIQIAQAHLSNGLLRDGAASVKTLDELFPGTSQPTSYNFDPVLASYIQLPDGRRFTFQYDTYGELARITLPTGGAYEYDYGDGNNGNTDGFQGVAEDNNPVMIYRRLQERREYPAGASGNAYSSITHYSVSYPASQTVDTEVVQDSSGNMLAQSIHTLNGSPLDALHMNGTSCNAWNEGLEVQTDLGIPAQLTVVNNYATQSGCMSNPQLTSRTTTLKDTNQVSQKTFSYDGYGNITDEADFDWGSGGPGVRLRERQSTYNTGAAYTSIGLAHLPTETKILNGAGVVSSDTRYNYDEGGIADAPDIVGHDNQNFASTAPRGNLTSVLTCPQTQNCSWLTTAIGYDIAGNAISVTDPKNHSNLYSYTDAYSDGQNRKTYAHVTSVTNALNQQTLFQYDFPSGRTVSSTNANGARTNYDYNDALDRLVQVTLPTGAQTAYSYPSSTEVDTYQDQTSAGDQALRSRQLYDGLGRLAETDKYESASQFIATTQTYDFLGRLASSTNPSRPGDGLNYATTYRYDTLGRATQATAPDGAILTTTYSGNTTTITDPAGKQRKFVKDALGRLTDVYEDPNGSNFRTQYVIDASNNLRQVIQGSQTRTFVYDSLNRLQSATNPESGTITYTYDAASNLQSRTDARGIVTTYAYDPLNRLCSKTYSDGTAAVNYSYDPAVANGKGQLASVVINGGSTTNFTSFDPVGNVLTSNQVTGGQTYSFTYSYNLAGSLTSEIYPSGRVVATAYDGANRVQSVTGNPGGQPIFYLSHTSYAPHGAPVLVLYGNTLWRQSSYNSRLQVNGYSDLLNNSATSQLLSVGLNYGTTSNNGNLQSVTYNHGGPGYPQLLSFTQSFGYDSLNRLSSASDSGGWSRLFNYDPYGNMWASGTNLSPLTPSTQNWIDASTNRLSSVSYDAAGNQTAVNGDALTYDAENRQTSATDPPSLGGGTETYVYDGNGKRVEKVGPSGTTVFVYDAFGELAVEYSTILNASPCLTCYLSFDPLGTPRLVTDQNGNVVARHDYLPFGEELAAGDAGRNTQWGTANDNVAQKFTGQFRDNETGLDYFNARYFGAALGRFTSPDPANAGADLNDPQTWNAYSYVRNNPVVLTDPSGQFLVATSAGAAGGAVGAGIGLIIDIFGAFFGLFGGGGGPAAAPPPPPPPPPVSSYPGGLPPGSFPGGETLGLPTGMTIPPPFGIPGLGNHGCDFGACTGGTGANGFFGPVAVGSGAGGLSIAIDLGLGTLCIGSGVCEVVAIGAGAVAIGAGAYIIYNKSKEGKPDVRPTKPEKNTLEGSQNQVDSIAKAQDRFRKSGESDKIQSIEKSKQRLNNQLKKIKSLEDLEQ